MMLRSLRSRLFALWLLLAAVAVAMALLLLSFFEETASVQIDRAQDQAASACRAIADRYAFFTASWSGPGGQGFDAETRAQLSDVVRTALARRQNIEGGIWQTEQGSLAYAYPTYEGSGPKTDLPAAEAGVIEEINAAANVDEKPATSVRRGNSQALILVACPLQGPEPGVTGWAMTRVFIGRGQAYQRLLLGLGVLSATVLGSALWLGYALFAWSRRIGRIETQLSQSGAETLPTLALTGERDLDRLVEALNASSERLLQARQRIEAAERLAALGRLTAGVAHEIRNPIAAMRLKAENALAAGGAPRQVAALSFILEQIARLDHLLRDLLSMSQRREPDRKPVSIGAFLDGLIDDFRDLAMEKGITLDARAADESIARDPPCVDAEQLRRALGNLVSNAIQHTGAGGRVVIEAARRGETLIIEVADTGTGVPPPIVQTLFEPFVTGRPDGTGLGLAIVQEIARGHGGVATLLPSETGARFRITLPWR